MSISTLKTGTLAEKLRIDENGNVGIGTTAPSHLLTVAGANGATGIKIQLNDNARTNWLIAAQYNVDGGLEFTPSTAVGGSTFSTPIVTIKNTGNVGIGTTSPTATLHLKAGTATASTAPLKFTSGTLLGTPEDGTIEYLSNKFYIRGSDGLIVNGDVGIGTTTPATKLHIYRTGGTLYQTVETNGTYSVGTYYKNGTVNYFVGASYATANAFEIYDVSNGVSRLTVAYTTGNIGIGETIPAYKLAISSGLAKSNTTEVSMIGLFSNEAIAANPFGLAISLKGAGTLDGSTIYMDTKLDGSTNGGNLIIQRSALGKVGIGCTPVSLFHVGGDIRQTGVVPILAGYAYGQIIQPEVSSAVTTEFRGISINTVLNAATYTVAAVKGIQINDANKGAGVTLTNSYGLYVDSITQGATNYQIYSAGAAQSYFAGMINASAGIIQNFPAAMGANTTWSGETIIGTAGENLVIGDVVYYKSDSKWWKAKADAYATARGKAIATASISANATGTLLLKGVIRYDTWAWTAASEFWLSAATAGLLTHTQPSTTGNQIQYLGWAIDADNIFFSPSMDIGEK